MATSYTYMYKYDHVHGGKGTQDRTKHLTAMLLNMTCTEAVPGANVCEHQHAKSSTTRQMYRLQLKMTQHRIEQRLYDMHLQWLPHHHQDKAGVFVYSMCRVLFTSWTDNQEHSCRQGCMSGQVNGFRMLFVIDSGCKLQYCTELVSHSSVNVVCALVKKETGHKSTEHRRRS